MSEQQSSAKQLRFLTAASLFDGHDVSVNIMRRLLQSMGVEVIHLGHNRSAQDVVNAAIMEDVHAVALSSYQGGHNEYFAYIRELLDARGANKIKIFGGGGGVITPKEIAALEAKGINKIYSPQDGMKLGLEGIIKDMIERASYDTMEGYDSQSLALELEKSQSDRDLILGKAITAIERGEQLKVGPTKSTGKSHGKIPVLGITGTGGAGKSSLIDEILLRFQQFRPDYKIALISVDPSKKRTKGALLGDRIRLGAAEYSQFFIRSLATRTSQTELSPYIHGVVDFLRHQDFQLIMVETSGIGQASDAITQVADKCLYVMTPEYGAQTQLEKIEMLEAADMVAVNKFEKSKGEDALRDVRKQYRRNKKLFDTNLTTDDDLPIFGTIASRFNDPGVNSLFTYLLRSLFDQSQDQLPQLICSRANRNEASIIPAGRMNYLQEIADCVRSYHQQTQNDVEKLRNYEVLCAANLIAANNGLTMPSDLNALSEKIKAEVKGCLDQCEQLDKNIESYRSGVYRYQVRDKQFEVNTHVTSLSHSQIPRVGTPQLHYPSDKYGFIRKENLPGFFPFTAGIFPFKRLDEEPKRQFAGEGGPGRTNKRFHYLCEGEKFKRLSTAFDSVTLYGEDPDYRPDIFGKVGESGVSIATLDDMELLYQGFDLTSPNTSVSKTINGPAPIILAMFMNAAINQKLNGPEREDYGKRLEVMRSVRGTVQADILKEDQAQNTCIFSLDFALKMMGDVQAFFCENQIKNYYTVSISGYHIAEAGANPITQLALTLSNGFTYLEYYLSRGLPIDDFCENLSFFFSNGLDPEYTVLGRVARRLWAITLRDKYGANIKSKKLKYHIQTSGRSLHAQEIDFNDIRTTLQAFLALSDNCNSLHTNAYDEAITTPTQESVRRAMAIQMIINREFGLNKTDNPLQGSYVVEELTDLVEEAVLKEFEKISNRGGVLGAMENMYQRSQIQEESLYYERLKDSGELPIIGVNTFRSPNEDHSYLDEIELTRASNEEKEDQINRLNSFKDRHSQHSQQALEKLRSVVLRNENIFAELLNTVRYCSLGQITHLLYEVGGRYRRNM